MPRKCPRRRTDTYREKFEESPAGQVPPDGNDLPWIRRRCLRQKGRFRLLSPVSGPETGSRIYGSASHMTTPPELSLLEQDSCCFRPPPNPLAPSGLDLNRETLSLPSSSWNSCISQSAAKGCGESQRQNCPFSVLKSDAGTNRAWRRNFRRGNLAMNQMVVTAIPGASKQNKANQDRCLIRLANPACQIQKGRLESRR